MWFNCNVQSTLALLKACVCCRVGDGEGGRVKDGGRDRVKVVVHSNIQSTLALLKAYICCHLGDGRGDRFKVVVQLQYSVHCCQSMRLLLRWGWWKGQGQDCGFIAIFSSHLRFLIKACVCCHLGDGGGGRVKVVV